MVLPCPPMDALVAAQAQHFTAQRARGQAKLQADSLALVEKHFDSIPTISTRRSARNRWARYSDFCSDNNLPLFPIVGTIVALSIHHLANGDPDTGKAYDSHTSVLNAARKASAYLWEGEPGCETAGLNITSNPGVKEFCARARKAALGARGGKVGEDSSAVGTPLRGSGKRKGVVEEGASEVSPPKRGASAKKRKVDLLPSSSTAAAAGGSGKKAAVPMPVKRGVGRPRKIVVDSPAPPVPKRSNRKKVAPPPSSSSSSDSSSDSSSSDSSDSDSDSPPPPPPKRSYKRKVGTASPAKPKPIVAKPKPAPVLSKGNLAKLEGRKGRATRRSEAQKKEDDLSTLTSLDTEEEAAMEIDQAEEERPTGVGMFGKIVRWFGFRAK